MKTTIREASRDDSAGILDIYGPVVANTAISFEVEVPTIEEMAERIEQTTVNYPWIVLEIDRQVAGYAYASQHRARSAYQWSVDVSVYVDERFRRRGVAKALYTSLFTTLELLGYVNMFAGIALPNPGSVGLHESMGFEPVGVYRSVGYKLGAWRDVGWWQRDLGMHVSQPKPPKKVKSVRGSDVWLRALWAGESMVDDQPLAD
ncbi:MAG: N-acetyltransferase [Anaerolineae bacterium]|nr:N-acetyltransferase [Anaerolineae bacterium]